MQNSLFYLAALIYAACAFLPARQRTVISALGRLIVLLHTWFPRLGDWIVLTTTRRLRHFYE